MDGTHGRIWWSELMTRDPRGARKFYADLTMDVFDHAADGRDYHVASRDGQPVAGIMDMTDLPGMREFRRTGSPISQWRMWMRRCGRHATAAAP